MSSKLSRENPYSKCWTIPGGFIVLKDGRYLLKETGETTFAEITAIDMVEIQKLLKGQ